MQFDQSLTTPVTADRVFAALRDVPLIASCMPGVELEGTDGKRHRGILRSRLGPISMMYRGDAWFEDVDELARTFRVVATGTESGGGGHAGVTVDGEVTGDGNGGARVDLHVDLQIAGRPAQFGRGLIVDVSNKMIQQFADNLADRLTDPTVREGALVGVEPAGGTVPVRDEVPSAWDLLPDKYRYAVVGVAGMLAGVAIGSFHRRSQ